MPSFQTREKTPAHLRPANTTDALQDLEKFEQQAGNAAAAQDAGLAGDGAAIGSGPAPVEEEAGPFDTPLLNELLGDCFGESLDGVSADFGADATNDSIDAVASTAGSHMAFGSDVGEDMGDPQALAVIAHETAHALAEGGSGATELDEAGDLGEAAADRAGERFASFARGGFKGEAPSLEPAAGGRAETHRHKKKKASTLLKLGAKGGRVKHVQQRLRHHGHKVSVDGDFGPNTEAAVRAFQSKKGLGADGVVGPQTSAALNKKAGGAGKPKPNGAKPNKKPAKKKVKVTGSPPLREGSKGGQVRALQKLLRISADGVFGAATKAAVIRFQSRKGLAADGVVGPVTAKVLNGGKAPGGGKLRWMTGNGGVQLGLVRRKGEWMLPRTASAFDQMNSYAKRKGVNLKIVDGFRSYREQVEIARRLGIYGQGGWAAVPGTSRHGLGVALDLWDGQGYSWLNKHAPKFGFRRTVPGEPWHWEV